MAIEVVVHTGAQPSHDWPVRKSFSDLDVNAVRTLIVPDAARRPPLTRWSLQPGHTYYDGISEDISIDHMLASRRGTSKVAADVRGEQDDRGDPGTSVEQRSAATTRLRTLR